MPRSQAFSGKLVTDAGMFATTQWWNPDPVGASGSNTMSAKLFVARGKFFQLSSGDRFCPPHASNAVPAGSVPPAVNASLVTWIGVDMAGPCGAATLTVGPALVVGIVPALCKFQAG